MSDVSEAPCWVREMDDATAYMALALNNAQGELSPLEVGLHALHSGLSGRAYAERVGAAHRTIADRMQAAEVAECAHVRTDVDFRSLTAIHPAPEWLWPALVAAMVAGEWTVEATRRALRITSQPGRRRPGFFVRQGGRIVAC